MDLREPAWLNWLAEYEPFSAAYLACESEHHVLRLAHALRAHWSASPVVIEPGDRLVGRPAGRGIGGYTFGGGIGCDEAYAHALSARFPEWREHLDALVAFWRGRMPHSRLHLPADESYLSGENAYWAGWGGHAVLGFEQVLAEGTEGIREVIRRRQAGEEDPDKRAFREALLIACDGIDAYAENHARAARWSGRPDIAAHCERVPRQGARTFPEALQSFWFIHVLDGCDSPGRIDQWLRPYYEADLAAGRLTREEAQDWMDHLWARFNDHRSWNVCAGGLLPEGSDGTNDLTYLALEATRRIQQIAPNLSLRLHRHSPPELWRTAVDVIATGVGMPALYNDEVLVPALMRYGIPETEARDYALNGCSQVDIQGRSHMGLEDGEIDLLKCLELALHDGFDPHTQQQLGPHTGDPRGFTSFEQMWQAYAAQVEYCTGRLLQAANEFQRAFAETSPNLLRSLFVKDCIEKGADFTVGGPRYNHGQILTQGIANTADSLLVLKRLVFDEGRITMAELLAHLDADFPDEAFRQTLIHGAPKYGNDEAEVDARAARAIEHFYSYLNTYRTWRGGTYGGGSIVFTRAPSFGAHVGATPDGRRAGTILADSVGPSQGRDAHGPTAMFRSVALVPQRLAQCAYVLNVKLPPQLLRESPEKVIALFQAYFAEGGQQIQVNVVDAEALRDARENPEAHQGLIVRVGGFSDYFVRLSDALQEDVIARTEHAV